MNTIETLSWIATIVTVTGAIMMARKNEKCWWVYTVGSAIWIAYGVMTKQWGFSITQAVFIGINIYGMWNWARLRKQPVESKPHEMKVISDAHDTL